MFYFDGCCLQDIDGKDAPLNKYQGKVCLVVNLASEWSEKGGWGGAQCSRLKCMDVHCSTQTHEHGESWP
jgi:hypothetical protein